MTKSAHEFLAQAMALPDADRVELAERLVNTWQPRGDRDYLAAWESEIRDRVREVESGQVTPIPWHDAIDHIRRGEGDAERERPAAGGGPPCSTWPRRPV